MPNISRSKDNQAMKFAQLIEYYMRKMFLEKLYGKCGGKTSPRSFSKKLKLSTSLDQQSKDWYTLFLLYDQVENYRNLLKLRSRPLAFTSYKAF